VLRLWRKRKLRRGKGANWKNKSIFCKIGGEYTWINTELTQNINNHRYNEDISTYQMQLNVPPSKNFSVNITFARVGVARSAAITAEANFICISKIETN